MITKPMLADKVKLTEFDKLRYPLIATPKLDGIRCLIIKGQAVSRKFLPIPNVHTRELLEGARLPHNLDGELMVTSKEFGDVTSAFMSRDGEPDFRFCVFDLVTREGGLHEPYQERLDTLKRWCEKHAPSFVTYVKETWVSSPLELERYESAAVAKGYEGIMVRDPSGPYKPGRSTLREGYLVKVKRFIDAEAVIIGFEEAETNTNEQVRDNVGHAKRSSAKAGKIAKGTLGALVVRGLNGQFKGVEFNIGTGAGLTAKLKHDIFTQQDAYLGAIVKYKYQAHGAKDAPRIPSLQGFRDKRDF